MQPRDVPGVVLLDADGFRVDPLTGLVYGPQGRPIGSLDGSGYWQVDGRSRGIGQPHHHRLVWIAVNGPVPDGFEVNHINGIKTDNRIANLELLTHAENIQHAYRIGLKSNAGEKHPCSRLNDEAVRAIRAARAAGVSLNQLGVEYGVHRRTITDVVLGNTWTHVKEAA